MVGQKELGLSLDLAAVLRYLLRRPRRLSTMNIWHRLLRHAPRTHQSGGQSQQSQLSISKLQKVTRPTQNMRDLYNMARSSHPAQRRDPNCNLSSRSP
jgi:hypothetical protein